MGRFGQFAATTQFFLHGKKHFTRSGWETHKAAYEHPDLFSYDWNLSGKVFLITGANSGVGKEVTKFLASQGAIVYMVCRSRSRAEAAKAEILAEAEAQRNTTVSASASGDKLHILEGDVSLEADVRRCWKEFVEHSSAGAPGTRLDGLVCNAGALLNTKTMTAEGVETTFAAHLLFGTYLLGTLALPTMRDTADSRLVVVSSGGMYNFPFPSWEVATATDPATEYDGQSAYAWAKRGQVILCEQWAAQWPNVKVVSCHPGWTGTPGVDAAYGDTKKWLEPLRSPWEGSEGIAWLCAVTAEKLQSGEFYLDRAPQVKHMAGPFFTEGSHTKNTPEEVESMMKNLEAWANRQQNGTASK